MYETSYAREPFDFRLFFLRAVKKLWLLAVGAAAGALIIGGIYYLVNMVFGEGYQYRATTIYYVTYAADESGTEYDYYNYYTWQELIHTDYFMEGLQEALGGELSKEYLLENTTATIDSDYRYLYTRSVSTDKAQAVRMEKAISELVTKFPEAHYELSSIEVIQEASEDRLEDISLIFNGRAALVGAIVGLLITINAAFLRPARTPPFTSRRHFQSATV